MCNPIRLCVSHLLERDWWLTHWLVGVAQKKCSSSSRTLHLWWHLKLAGQRVFILCLCVCVCGPKQTVAIFGAINWPPNELELPPVIVIVVVQLRSLRVCVCVWVLGRRTLCQHNTRFTELAKSLIIPFRLYVPLQIQLSARIDEYIMSRAKHNTVQ